MTKCSRQGKAASLCKGCWDWFRFELCPWGAGQANKYYLQCGRSRHTCPVAGHFVCGALSVAKKGSEVARQGLVRLASQVKRGLAGAGDVWHRTMHMRPSIQVPHVYLTKNLLTNLVDGGPNQEQAPFADETESWWIMVDCSFGILSRWLQSLRRATEQVYAEQVDLIDSFLHQSLKCCAFCSLS